ncbi:MAG: glycosyltransferase [Bacilli bacterium]|nr:glycosyltransferase [Bacilli bacterium]
MKRLKIGMFMDSFYPDINGVILVMENLLRCMSEYADVTLVVPKTGSEKDDKNYPFKIIRIDSVPLLKTGYRLGMVDLEYSRLKRKFKKLDFDIIHIHSPFALGRLGVRVARDKKIPCIATMHTRWEFELKKYLKSNKIASMGVKHLIKTYNKCDKCIALNKALMKVYRDYGYTGEFELINNGTDLETVKDKKKALDLVNKQYNIGKNETVFLFVGRIISVKNIYFILDTLKELKARGKKFKMLFVGSGPDFNELKSRIHKYDMEDCVIMTGKILDRELLKAIYYRATLFLFPSLFDSSSLVQIEAASQETPTIFIEGSVTSDTVENNINGFTEKEDVELFANRIEEILNDKELYEKVQKGAKNDLAKPWSEIAKETYKFYLKMIELNEKN